MKIRFALLLVTTIAVGLATTKVQFVRPVCSISNEQPQILVKQPPKATTGFQAENDSARDSACSTTCATALDASALLEDLKQVNTGNSFDIAIQGPGFFRVLLPCGEYGYTRHGRFRLNATGQLMIDDEFHLQPPITLPLDTTCFNIGSDGTVSAVTESHPNAAVIIGNINLVRFPNPYGLNPFGRRLFFQTTASGFPMIGVPESNGFGNLRQGFLELSIAQIFKSVIDLIGTELGFVSGPQATAADEYQPPSILTVAGSEPVPLQTAADFKSKTESTGSLAFLDAPAVVVPQEAHARAAISFDLRIEGPGFFQVTCPDGSLAFSRGGKFRCNADGQLVINDKFVLQPPITIPNDTKYISMGSDGTVAVVTESDPNASVLIANIQLARFPNPSKLALTGNGAYVWTTASGPCSLNFPDCIGFGALYQGFLELSNVEFITEMMDLITSPVGCESNRCTTEASDEMRQPRNTPPPRESPRPVEMRIKDLTTVEGDCGKQLIGLGLVVGLDGTGSRSPATRKMVIEMLRKLEMTTKIQRQTQIDNVIKSSSIAMVLVTTEISPDSRKASRLDVVVSTLDDSTSLDGGTLLLTPLRGADGEVYAVAQGNISIAKNSSDDYPVSPTNARISGGAILERNGIGQINHDGVIRLLLRSSGLFTSSQIVDAINKRFPKSAVMVNTGTVQVCVPRRYEKDVFLFKSELEEIAVDAPARVEINERTGAIISGHEVRVATVAVAHGSLLIRPAGQTPFGGHPKQHAREIPENGRSCVKVSSPKGTIELIEVENSVSAGEMAEALSKLGVSPEDLIAIFNALRESGAMRCELTSSSN